MEKTITISISPAFKLLPESPEKQVIQNVAVILATKRGECPLDRELGISQEYLGKPLPVAQTLLTAAIIEAMEREPRAEFVSASYKSDSSGKIVPTVEVKINV